MDENRRQDPYLEEVWVGHLQIAVLKWFDHNSRIFPWRETANPFFILVAEVLLRQTQASRVIGPYHNLTERFRNPKALAEADVSELRTWFTPLGLIRRADNLISTAKILQIDHDGIVPKDLEVLMALPGIGMYSARAVLCLAFREPVPMIDESSGRVLRRVLGIASAKPAFADNGLLRIAQKIIPEDNAREFNLGILDLGAVESSKS